MFRWFRKTLTVEEQYHKVKNIGIVLNPGISLDQVISDFRREEYEEKPYYLLFIAMGSELASNGNSFLYASDDFWHFDRECIEDHGDYIPIIKRIAEILKDEFIVNEISDYVDIENNEIWVSFKINGNTYKYELLADDDWLDISIFKLFSELLEKHGSKRRFYYFDLGQGMLVGAYNKERWKSLNKLTNIWIPVT
ncbi:hypothetical protein [Paenibacillus sp. MBLB4367]|uniref:hypothetical protein n=1 Tax=Paenibacillus sp. MBLB4367 TaxID=3384767 RepID=UPI0039083EC5